MSAAKTEDAEAGTKRIIRLDKRGDVAIVTIDNPPVNATSAEVRKGLLDAVEAIDADESVSAAVLIGEGRNFVAGADIREFGKPLADPQAPDVIAAIETSGKPFVAAIRGAALGGGFELALGCDARVAAPDAIVGLPEITLGFIPGAGGTQRLPRLLGVSRALEIVTSGRRLPAKEAAELGIIDAIVSGDLLGEAVEFAKGISEKRRLRDRAVPEEPAEAIAEAESRALKKAAGKDWIGEAIDAVKRAASEPFDDALAHERAVFQRLRVSEEAFALRHLFFAERAAGRMPGLDETSARRIDSVALIGGGAMGSGIAVAMLSRGVKVTLLERDAEALETGTKRVRGLLERSVQTGHATAADVEARLAAFSGTVDQAAMHDADLVLEAVFEDMELKKTVFAEMGQRANGDAVLASNTSYLDLAEIAAASGHPKRVVGLHFFMPPHIMKLVEVVRGPETADETLAAALSFARRLGKIPVVAGNGEGFIGNAIYSEYRRHCEFMLEDGAYPEDVDGALERFGFAMGPFRVTDLSGLDISAALRARRRASLDPRERYVSLPDELCELGRLGRKTGAGWYAYDDKGTAIPDPAVRALIDEASEKKGIARRTLSEDEIVARALGAMVSRGAQLLADGIAREPADIDVVMANGYGFPRHKGGPMFWASRQAPEALARVLESLEAATGFGFRRGDVASAVSRLSGSG
jgi:3-hydroxyacyl-CoA dehydrogenase